MTMPPGPPSPYGQPFYQPGQPYYQHGQPWYPPAHRNNWWAIVSLVAAIFGILLVSVVCGIVGLNKARWYGGRSVAIAGLVVSGVWALLLFAGGLLGAISSEGTTTVDRLEAGDCLAEIPDEVEVRSVRTVGCDEVHAGEVFGVLTMPDGDYPGQAAIDAFTDRCGPQLAAYAPSSVHDDRVDVFTLHPTREGWELGDRAVTCIATLEPSRSGSINR